MTEEKMKLIDDIQQLLNSYANTTITTINPDLLEFMDEETLKSIIHNILDQQEHVNEDNREWLAQFKTDYN
ncbi:MAG: hypothetical protein U9N52_02520 [Campylobacterota bacterium]|nr:hypothetical protein [Campylobacterota bacterium]